jgi:hypothetical protein
LHETGGEEDEKSVAQGLHRIGLLESCPDMYS